MKTKKLKSPAHKYVKHAEKVNKLLGHENLGFLSFKRGFVPLNNPIESLPYPFSKWDDIAKELPYHYKNQSLREAIKKLPVLSAQKNLLEDKFLCRASMLLSMLAHAYVRNERDEDLDIPLSITRPWQEISDRLKRPQPFLSYIDLIIYNWKFKNSRCIGEVNDLELLTPTVNNQEENVFYLTQTEIAFKTNKILANIVAIQDAIINDDKSKVVAGLQALKKVVVTATKSSFLKINPNPRSATYVDPVVWAKTVAPFAVPLKEGVQGPSGTSSPFFHLIDTFIERNKYETILGKEALFIREWYPEHWRNFLQEVDKISITKYIEKCNDQMLYGAFYEFVEAYSGDQGFLGVHRRKVYGYLQMAFKVGRSVTIGGFSGLFKERTWEEVDDELETTRLERYTDKKLKCPYSGVIKQSVIDDSTTKKVVLDVSEKGVHFEPGDRCAVVPKNKTDIVFELLSLMSLGGKETVFLNHSWSTYFKTHYNKDLTQSTVYEVLCCAKLNDASKALEMCGHIRGFIQLEANGEIPLLSLIKQFKKLSMDAKQFLVPHLATILQPEHERMYSISSGFENNQLELTVGDATTIVEDKIYKGVASSYLHSNEVNKQSKIPFRIVSPLRFSLPKQINVPIYLFAGGSGIAPFKGFWEALEKSNNLHNLSVFYSVKRVEDILFKEDLKRIFLQGQVRLNILVTRQSKILDIHASKLQNDLVFRSIQINHVDKFSYFLQDTYMIQNLFRAIQPSGNKDKAGYFYSCGKAGFALSVLNFIKKIIRLNCKNNKSSQELFYRLFSENRIMQDIFTTPNEICDTRNQSYYMSDIIAHNTPKSGYWVAIDQKVYDLTEFKEIHPGGDKIIEDNAGRDATHEFRKANHHLSREITSMLTMYCIGRLNKVVFKSISLEIQYKDWLSSLHLVTEMYNTFIADHSFKERKTTALTHKTEITPYKLALLSENQRRFSYEYVKNIREIFENLFYDSPSFNSIIEEFTRLTTVQFNFKDKYIALKKSIVEEWIEQEHLELKNVEILKIVRKTLCEGVKLFEVNRTIESSEFNDAVEIILNNCYQRLEQLNQLELTGVN